jgi:hypothetical protein
MRTKQLIILLAVFVMAGCYYDNEDELYPNNGGTVIDTSQTVSYAADIKPIIDGNCATSNCHVSGAQSPALTNYQQTQSNSARIKVRAVEQKDMPSSGPLSASDISKLQKWIDGGSPNN